MAELFEGYEISLSRSPDGRPVVTTDANVPMANGCMIGNPDTDADLIYVHLDVRRDGRKFAVWVCVSNDHLQKPDLESAIIADKGPEIIAAVQVMEAA
ncbi:MAG TPA: hypothetical protein VJ464_10500 [Blastocatellia bacterium]|nr:hypothetical protein [Blastocatellia bacterium]